MALHRQKPSGPLPLAPSAAEALPQFVACVYSPGDGRADEHSVVRRFVVSRELSLPGSSGRLLQDKLVGLEPLEWWEPADVGVLHQGVELLLEDRRNEGTVRDGPAITLHLLFLPTFIQAGTWSLSIELLNLSGSV